MAKLKDVLFYTIKRGWLNNYEILAVTTEKRRQYFGRRVEDNSATHVTVRDCHGKFSTAEEAKNKTDGIKKIQAAYMPLIDEAAREFSRLHNQQTRDIDRVLRGEISG
jgi:hypothetical protein